MSIQEWLARNSEPSPFGGVDVGARPRLPPSRAETVFLAIVSGVLLAGWGYLAWRICGGRFDQWLVWMLVTPLYLAAGYFIHPDPNPDNLGWFGGLMNNPFRISDNVNRGLLALVVFLWPGRFVAESLMSLLRPPGPAAPAAPAAPPGPPPPGSPWPAPFQWPSPAPAPGPGPPAAPVWTAEEVVSPELAAHLIEEQFPALAPVQVAALGVGWDNIAYLADEAYVFRFPRREVAVPLLETEARVLPQIAARLPLPVPVPDLIGKPSAAYPWPFAGYPFLEGRTACRANLDAGQRMALAEPLGQFLAALHAVPVDQMVALGVGGDSIGRLDLTTRVPRALEVLGRLPPAALGVDPGVVRGIIEGSASIRAPAAQVLAHGDLYVRHLLVDEQARLCGVIDWGDLHVGNPAVDLSVAYGFLPPEARPAFLRGYAQRVPAPTWWLARFRAVFHALCLLDYALQIREADLEREARQSLTNAVAGS